MALLRAACSGFLALTLALAFGACGSSDSHPGPATSSSGGALNIGIGGSSTGGSIGPVCAGELSTAELIPLDIFLMLDASGSMSDPTGADPNLSKWDAIVGALRAFLEDDASAGIAVGLQYFPIRKPDAPNSCTDNASCGDSAPCLSKLCENYFEVALCDTDLDCGIYAPCVQYGECENDPTWVCWPIGSVCGDDPNGVALGPCQEATYVCGATAVCDAAAYANPAVPIAVLPDAAPDLVASIEGRELRADALTPTGPALAGAVTQAEQWASTHPGHRVVALLATDGLPTECEPIDIIDVAGLARTGASGTPSISTFVIGVIGSEDQGAAMNLDAIAEAGGTQQAFLVDADGDVEQEFLDSLAEIRGTKLACEFRIPAADSGQTLDFLRVNVQFDNAGASTRLLYVGSAAGCDAAQGGWYYDVEPAAGMPTKIVVCSASCQSFEGATDATVQIELGCQTSIR